MIVFHHPGMDEKSGVEGRKQTKETSTEMPIRRNRHCRLFFIKNASETTGMLYQ